MKLPNVDFGWLYGNRDGVTEGCKVTRDADRNVVEGRRFCVAVLYVLVDVGSTVVNQEGVDTGLASGGVVTFMGGPVVPIEGGGRSPIKFVVDNVKDLASMNLRLQDWRILGVDVEICSQEIRNAVHQPHTNEGGCNETLIGIEVRGAGTGTRDTTKAGDD